jgi:predicted DNA-binding transcriptional regulator AlpA
MSPDQVSEETGITKGHLAQLRYMGKGPSYHKISAKKILYKESDIKNWLESTSRTTTSNY